MVLALVVLVSLLTAVLIKIVCERCEAFELHDRVSEACEALDQSSPREDNTSARALDTPLRPPYGGNACLQQGSALASLVSVYRSGLWQRVPKLVLVEGDVVALMGGDTAPCMVEVLCLEAEADVTTDRGSGTVKMQQFPLAFQRTGTKVVGGHTINLRPTVGGHFSRKTMVSATSPALLLLCGDMRCYLLLETPLEAHLQRSLSPAGTKRRNSLIRERVRIVSRRCHTAAIIISLLAAIVGGIRLVLAGGLRGSRDEWALHLLVIPSQIAVCLLPMSLPIHLAAGETVATAHLLAFLELMLRRKSETKGIDRSTTSDPERDRFDQMDHMDQMDQMDAEEREEATSGISHSISWREVRAYLFAVLTARWRSGTRRRASERVPAIAPESPISPEHVYQEPDAAVERAYLKSTFAPVEDRPEADPLRDSNPGIRGDHETLESKHHCRDQYQYTAVTDVTDVTTSGRMSSSWWRRRCSWMPFFLQRDRSSSFPKSDDIGAKSFETDSKQMSRQQVTLLAVPMLRSGLVERLGAVTTLCMLDEDTVCQATSVIKEVFLLDSKDDAGGGSGTVLDLHAQHGKKRKRGVRFEDPHWSTHLPALKPIGLSCLLAEVQHLERQQQQAKAKSTYSSPAARESVAAPSQTRPGRALLHHVQDNQPMEHLTDLWKAIGFCSADRSIFRERRRIHVINPNLAAERATEDTHAQGQEESRRRGTIQPHVTSVMAQDRRSGTLQLHSQGNPCIVLGMCRDYWDGSAISDLPASLRKSILLMHQQWSLEDLDVLAFAYTPLPYTVNPFLLSSSKNPDYLIHTTQGAGKWRSRGGLLSPASPLARKSTNKLNVAKVERTSPELFETHQIIQPHVSDDTHGDGDGDMSDKTDERTNSRLRFSGNKTNSSWHPEVLRRAERQTSGPQILSAGSSLGTFQGSESRKPQIGPDSANAVGVGGSEGCGLTQEGSEGCIAGAVFQGTHSDRALRTVFEDVSDSHCQTEEVVTESRPSLGDGTNRSTARSRNTSGQRRYSVDDYGVNIRNRPEHHSDNNYQSNSNSQRAATTKAGKTATGDKKMADMIWNLMHEQVFLGMAASFVPPKRDIVALIEDVEAAGVRFVYFSPRNMRRSKALAESMGIETDWNCAISLRPLEDSSQPDPHRMTSSYADWDVKARLPHGIASIRDHIERVDNVPLLVSLFTDATPTTTGDMLGIYQENDESVLAVGMSHRAVNGDLFRTADLSFSVEKENLLRNRSLASLPSASTSIFSAIDATFNTSIVGLHAALFLGDVVRRGDTGTLGGLDEIGSIVIDLIREGRRLLANSYQALCFLLLGSFTLAVLVLVSACVPLSAPMVLKGDHIIWVVWLVVPLLAWSFLASPIDGTLMKMTPEKNDPKVIPIVTRMVVHMLLRTLPTVLICVGLYVFLIGKFLVIDGEDIVLICFGESHGTEQGMRWTDIIRCLARDGLDTDSTGSAAGQATDLVVAELVLCLIVQSACFMYRTTSVRKEHPWKNWVWCYAVMLIVILQVTYLWASAAARNTPHLLSSCPWEAMVVGALCPLAIGLIAEVLKVDDARAHDRYKTLLRLEFDTRLGMHSPR